MPLTIRDPRAAELARTLAARRGTTMTEAVITALEAEIERDRQHLPVAERLLAHARAMVANAGPNRREVTKDEIDAMWGQ
jgi:antitoxin VapB